MAPPLGSQILFALGGKSLATLGTLPWRKTPPGAGGEIPYTFSRADASTCATYIDYDGVIRQALANVARVEWVDLDGDGIRETPGILLESTRINELQRSEELDNAYWTKGRLSVSANQTTAPDGTVTADKLIEDATNNTHIAFSGSVAISAGAALAASGFFKTGTRSKVRLAVYDSTIATEFFHADFDLNAGTVIATGGAGIGAAHIRQTSPALGHYRCMVEGTGQGGLTTAALIVFILDNAGTVTYAGDGASHLFAWGMQLEKATFPSSYIKTVAGAITRADDSLTVPFNFGPMDFTTLVRIARPIHADAVGTLGISPRIYELGTPVPFLRTFFNNTTRQFFSQIDTAVTDGTTGGVSIPAGAGLTYLTQYRNLTTGGQIANDAGSGISGFSTAASAFSAFGNQTLYVGQVGGGGERLNAVLIDLIIARGLFSLSDMLAIPL